MASSSSSLVADYTFSSTDDEDVKPPSKIPRIIQIAPDTTEPLPPGPSSGLHMSPDHHLDRPTSPLHLEISFSSSSSEPEIQPTKDTAAPDPALTSDPAPPPNKRSYALEISQLPDPMKTFMKAVKEYFTQRVNLKRQKPALSDTTYAKAQERILCYLGFLHMTAEPLTPESFLRVHLIEAYVNYLREQRQCGAATVSNHISSLLYPIKFIHRESAPDFANVQIIRQLRVQATMLQKEGDLDRPSTQEEFEAQNRWLPWNEVVRAVGIQRERFEAAGSIIKKSRESCDLAMLSLYVFIPPSRGMEIRTLEIAMQNFDPKARKGLNTLVVKDDSMVLHVHNYKTKGSHGKDELTLQQDQELYRILKQYVTEFRPRLVQEGSGNYLLLNRNGNPFTGPAFSAHLRSLFLQLTGKQVAVNMLRSSFITWAYSQSDCTDALKSSLASALRHSKDEAQKTYDRRTANERKGLALSFTRLYAESELDEGAPESSTAQETADDDCEFKPGDFVGLVQEDSTLMSPKILIGQVHAFQPNGDVSLLWYKCVSPSHYKMQFSGESWIEGVSSLVAVSLKPAKNKPGLYRLTTSLRGIHKAVKNQK